MNTEKLAISLSDTAIASESEDETENIQISGEAVPAPGPFGRTRNSRGSNQSNIQPRKRRESNVNVDNIHQALGADDISPAQLYSTESGHLFHAGKLAVVLVGLPARGKTHHSVALTRYLRWLGVKTHTFHLGDYRRKLGGSNFKTPDDYFKPNPSESTAIFRQKVFDTCMSEIFSFFTDGGQVAIYDAVNSSTKIRKNLLDTFTEKSVSVLFVECIATDDHLVARNVRDVKLSSPDYQGIDYKDAVRSYLRRIELRIPFYEPMGALENDLSYVKLINGVEQIKLNKAPLGYLQNRIVFFLMNTHIKLGNYYFARAGQSEESELTYRDDGGLSERGHEYAQKLKQTLLAHLEEQYQQLLSGASTLGTATPTEPEAKPLARDLSLSQENIAKRLAEAKRNAPDGTDKYTTPTPTTSSTWTKPVKPERKSLNVWSSKRARTVETARYFAEDGIRTTHRTELTQLNPGEVDGFTTDEIKAKYPEEYNVRIENPYHHRYPGSESYHDVAVRLEPLVMEMERHEGDLLVIAHESVLKVLYGYLMACSVTDIPFLKFPKNEIVEIKPGAYYNAATRITIEGVDP